MAVSISAAILAATALAIAIFALVRANAAISKSDSTYSTMRDRIGRLVKEINSVNELEYNVDVQQQDKINKLLGATPSTK